MDVNRRKDGSYADRRYIYEIIAKEMDACRWRGVQVKAFFEINVERLEV